MNDTNQLTDEQRVYQALVLVGSAIYEAFQADYDDAAARRLAVLEAVAPDVRAVAAAALSPEGASDGDWRRWHVPVTNEQQKPDNGLLAGFCERCRVPWPCPYSPESAPDATCRDDIRAWQDRAEWAEDALRRIRDTEVAGDGGKAWEFQAIAAEALRTVPEQRAASVEVDVQAEVERQMFDAAGGVVFIIIRSGRVLMERCPKKATMFGGDWFLPGGKIEAGESPEAALRREMEEELGVRPTVWESLVVLDGAPDGRPFFPLRPFLIHDFKGRLPAETSLDGVPLSWMPLEDAARSTVVQVRMMLAAALATAEAAGLSRIGAMETVLRDAEIALLDAEPLLYRAPQETQDRVEHAISDIVQLRCEQHRRPC